MLLKYHTLCHTKPPTKRTSPAVHKNSNITAPVASPFMLYLYLSVTAKPFLSMQQKGSYQNPCSLFVWSCPPLTQTTGQRSSHQSHPHPSLVFYPGYMNVTFTLSVTDTEGMEWHQQRYSASVNWSLHPFVLTLFSFSCVKSYKGFLLHTLLANCIKAFRDCFLSPCVFTSIKKRELQHVESVPDIISPALSAARMHKPGDCDRGIFCLALPHPPIQQTQPDRKFIILTSLFSLQVTKW